MQNLSDSKFDVVSIDELKLDLGNPRIKKWVEMYEGPVTDDQMRLALGADSGDGGDPGTTYYSLRESIRASGGIIHPIIVNRQNDGQLVVIEGNTRTLIYRDFRAQNVRGEWDKIPAMVYSGLSDADIDRVRLQAHLVGPRAWDPYSKAKYLDFLRNSEYMTMAQIVELCGGREREVQQYIQAYETMERYYRPVLESEDEFDTSRFSAFVELEKNPRIKQAILETRHTYTDFAKWVRDRLVYPLSTVRQLPRILSADRARAVFLRDGAQAALRTLDAPAPDTVLAKATLYQLAREVTRQVAKLPFEELQRLKSELGSDDNDALCEARDSLVQLCTELASPD